MSDWYPTAEPRLWPANTQGVPLTRGNAASRFTTAASNGRTRGPVLVSSPARPLHDVRRSPATRHAGAVVNAYILRDVLGHKSLTMSNRYVRVASDALAEAVEKGAALTAEAMEGRQ